jgi:hypothetical protein
MRPDAASRGFSALEAIVAVVLFGIAAVALRNPMRTYMKRLEFEKSVDNVKHMIMACQTKAMSDPGQHVGVWFGDSVAVPFLDKGSPALYEYDRSADPAYMGQAVLRRGVRLRKLPGFPDEIVFRGDGSAYKSLRIVITDGVLQDTLDVLASTGRVRVLR